MLLVVESMMRSGLAQRHDLMCDIESMPTPLVEQDDDMFDRFELIRFDSSDLAHETKPNADLDTADDHDNDDNNDDDDDIDRSIEKRCNHHHSDRFDQLGTPRKLASLASTMGDVVHAQLDFSSSLLTCSNSSSIWCTLLLRSSGVSGSCKELNHACLIRVRQVDRCATVSQRLTCSPCSTVMSLVASPATATAESKAGS